MQPVLGSLSRTLQALHHKVQGVACPSSKGCQSFRPLNSEASFRTHDIEPEAGTSSQRLASHTAVPLAEAPSLCLHASISTLETSLLLPTGEGQGIGSCRNQSTGCRKGSSSAHALSGQRSQAQRCLLHHPGPSERPSCRGHTG